MLTVPQFLTSFPAFSAIPAAMITKALGDAEARTDADLFGDLTDEAHGCLTASILHRQLQVGVRSQGQKPEDRDIHLKRREELEGLVAGFQGGVV